MQSRAAVAAAALAAIATPAAAGATGAGASPVAKVLDLLGNLEAKVQAEGVAAQKEYEELSEWCKDGAKNLAFEIKTAKGEIEDLKATIEEQSSVASSLGSKLEELGAGAATDEADLKAATKIRSEEAKEFKIEEKELVETIDTIERAVGILEREMRNGGGSALQLQHAGNLATALTALVQASVLSSADAQRLTALVQSGQAVDDAADDAELGAPAAAVYEGHSNSIIDVLEDLGNKAQEQLAAARKKEANALHNFQMLEQSLKDQLKFNAKDTEEARKALAVSGEKKALAEGDLKTTSTGLEEDEKALGNMKQSCMTSSQDFEAAKKSRAEELQALAEAKKAIQESTAAADSLNYGLAQVSLLQTGSSTLSSKADLVNFEAVRLVRDLARREKAPELAQLASRMASAMRLRANAGEDPFAKVRGLISDMIERLERDAQGDASHKAYCDKELAESKTKKGELEHDIGKLSTKIDSMKARSAQLKEETASLQKALSDLASSQAEATKMRSEEKATFVKNKADTEQGLEGVKMALKILREYYAQGDKAHAAAEGAATSIVGLLEVVESDFSKALAEMTTAEETAAVSYEQTSQENRVLKATKEKDVQYKAKEAADLDKAVAEANSDRSGLQAENDAVVEYLAKLDEMCIAKPETYEARAERRQAEIAGLKEALQILSGNAVLMQSGVRSLRGVMPHRA
eukprot:TRINITY_DN1944_c1_g1_i1.p1 TRINITY_DN1944_c1_g1~~TRINITY_DN1944_c1_g1_i1.p1  ORF type:complete len:721 (+),score=275.94 TRINITY_DN1944_c1_g1_i1:76-2163(+)